MGSDGARGKVLVLKERSANQQNGGLDPYDAALSRAGYVVHFLPVLSHRLVNLDKIGQFVSADPAAISTQDGSAQWASSAIQPVVSRFAGVVFTSQRAVEAWAKAGQAILESDAPLQSAWHETPFYAVGPATASALLRLDSRLRPSPSLILGAEESGSAERLASYITSRSRNTSNSPLLYLVGDKRKDTLPSLLQQQGIAIYEIQAYETFQSSTFEADYAVLKKEEQFDWIVFFSPSGVKLLIPLLGTKEGDSYPNLAAIGPTTRDFLISQYSLEVAAMASSPTPESLLEAMLAVPSP